MTIEKLPSGNYRIRQQYNGIRYSVVIDHKPTKAEALQALADVMDEAPLKGSFHEYARKYLNSRDEVISPATFNGYESILRAISKDFKDKPMSRITPEDVQLEINRYSKKHAPKSVYNLHGFIAGIINLYRPKLILNTTLPQKVENEMRIPTDEEVAAVLALAKGTPFEVPIWLGGANGLRRSEIAALEITDLSDDNMLTINKAKVRNKNGKGYVLKHYGKTETSNRIIAIDEYIADVIRKQGYVYNKGINSILYNLHKYQKILEIEPFTLHAMRHYFASAMHNMNIPSKETQTAGGWKTDHVMKKVYTHAMEDKNKEKKKENARKLAERISKALQ